MGAEDNKEIAAYDEIVARHADAADPELREQAARALVSKGITLGEMKRAEEAIAVYDDVVRRYASDPGPSLGEPVSGALLKKAVELGGLDRWDEAFATYDQIVDRYADAAEPAVRAHAAMALFNKGLRLGALGRWEEEIAVNTAVIDRFADAPGAACRPLLTDAAMNKHLRLMQLGRADEAKATLHDAVSRGDPAAARQLVWLAASSKDYRTMEEAEDVYGRLTIAREVEGQWWANEDLDCSKLSSEQLEAASKALFEFAAPYKQKWADGERDPDFAARGRAALQLSVTIRRALTEEFERRAAISAAVAERAQQSYAETVDRIVGSTRAAREMQPIPGCRLVTGPSGEGVPNVTLAVRAPEAVELLPPAGSQGVRIPWEVIRGFQIEPLPDRARVTPRRAAAVGILALAAKKRQAWCVLTILWDGRYRTVEVPAQAHELRAAFDAAGIRV